MNYVLRGKPLVNKSPRLRRWGKGTYDPIKKEKMDAQWELKIQCPTILYTTEPLHAHIVFYMPRPKSKKDTYWHTTRPDSDNMEKALLDICKGVIYKDDSIVCSVTKKKVYDDIPRIEFSFNILKESNEHDKKKS